jgi:hypothetical protein
VNGAPTLKAIAQKHGIKTEGAISKRATKLREKLGEVLRAGVDLLDAPSPVDVVYRQLLHLNVDEGGTLLSVPGIRRK